MKASGNGLRRADFDAIAEWVKPGSRVLDLGCGDGVLLKYLKGARAITGYGVEIDDANVLGCVTNGINVIQSDLERELAEFESASFDYVILSQTLQAVRNTEGIVRDMLRVAREGIVTFPNFGYWRNRFQVLLGGMPVSDNLPYTWFDTPNVHLCTISDFEAYCASHDVRILDRTVITNGQPVAWLPNLLGALAVYRFQRA